MSTKLRSLYVAGCLSVAALCVLVWASEASPALAGPAVRNALPPTRELDISNPFVPPLPRAELRPAPFAHAVPRALEGENPFVGSAENVLPSQLVEMPPAPRRPLDSANPYRP